MRRTRFLLILLALSAAVFPAGAQTNQNAMPSVVTAGLDALVAGDPERAVLTWSATWDADARENLSSLQESLNNVKTIMGNANGYELVQAMDVGPRLRKLYVMVLYDRQPLFAYFEAYRPKDSWQVTSVSWNTDAAEVFPASLLEP